MYRISFLIFITLCFVCDLSISYGQDSVVLLPTRDNTLYEDPNGALSNGEGQFLFIGTSAQNLRRRTVLAFDVANVISAGTAIDSVQLKFTMSRTISGPQEISLHRITRNWGEGASSGTINEGSGGPSMGGDATWIHAFYDSTAWSAPGGDFSPEASAVFQVDAVADYTIPSSINMLEDVKHWLDHPEENFGWMVMGDESAASTSKRFNSRENEDASTHPMLEIFFSMPTAVEENETPASLQIYPNYPNPFSTSTVVLFDIAEVSLVHLDVYDLLGQRVWSAPAQVFGAGTNHHLEVNGASFASGVYLGRLTVLQGGVFHVKTQRMTVLR